MEQITRAKTKLYILLVDRGYSKTKGYFQQAAEEGLVEIVKLNDAEANEENEGSGEVKEIEDVNKGDSCLPGCCTS